MKKILIIAILILLKFTPSFAKYYTTFLPTLIENSHIIVYGRIVSIDKTNFRIQVIKIFKSKVKSDTLTIKQFRNWTCAIRYTEYKVGQEAIYFLRIDEDKNLKVMGAGNEGELIVKDRLTYIEDFDFNNYETKSYDFLPYYKKYIKLDIESVIEGIYIYLNNNEVINREFLNFSTGRVVYQYSYIDRLPRNDFLAIVIDQKRRMYRITYKL